MFGIPARVRLSDGVMETLADSSQASGSPTQRGADVDATDYVYGNLNGLQRVRVADLPGGPASLLVALPPLDWHPAAG